MPLYEIITIEHVQRVYHMEAATEAEARERLRITTMTTIKPARL